MTNLSAAVFDHLRRSLATEGNKIILNEFGEVQMTSDVLDIIRSLNAKHPIIKLLEEHIKYIYVSIPLPCKVIADNEQARCHISSPLAITLLISLVERAVALVTQYKITPHHFERYWMRVLELTKQYTQHSAVVPDSALVHEYCARSLRGALLLTRDTIGHLSNTALQLVGQHCHVLEVTGSDVSSTVLHHVTVLSDTCPITCWELRVMCVSVALEHVIAPLFDALVELAPDLLLCLAIDTSVKTRLAQYGITALVVTAEQLAYLALQSGGTIQTTLDHVIGRDEDQLGHVTRIEVESDECLQQYLISFTEFPTIPRDQPVHEPITVLIRAPHPALARQCRRALFDTVAQVTRVKQSTVLLLTDDTCQSLAQLAPAENELLREVWSRAWLELSVPRDTVLDSHVLNHVIEAVLHTALKILRVDQVLSM